MACTMTARRRVLEIFRFLRGRWATVYEMQKVFGVSRRTLYYDLRAIEDAGFVLLQDTEPGCETLWRVSL